VTTTQRMLEAEDRLAEAEHLQRFAEMEAPGTPETIEAGRLLDQAVENICPDDLRLLAAEEAIRQAILCHEAIVDLA